MSRSTTWTKQTLQTIGIPSTKNINPANHPDEIFELYSVPAYSNGQPDIVVGAEIGSSKQIVEPGDVLLCKIVPHLNRVWVVPAKDRYRQIASGEWIVIRNKEHDPAYIRQGLMQPTFRQQFMETVSGVGGSLMRARPELVSKVQIALAPLEEQRRVVAKLDGLFARSQSAREELGRVPKLVERYKQAVLAAAFRGELTAEWRNQSDVEPIPLRAGFPIDGRIGPSLQFNPLPSSWAWHSIADLAAIKGGVTKNPSRSSLPLKIPYLRVANVYAGELRLGLIEKIGVTPAEAERIALRDGDLLIVEGNGSVDQIGRVALWNGEIPGCGHQNHLIKVSPKEGIVPQFLLYWLMSPQGREAIESVASSSSGLHTLSITKVSGLPVPYCSREEMHEVVGQIRKGFVAVEGAFQEASRGRGLLDRLDQAVLSKAFRGELTNTS